MVALHWPGAAVTDWLEGQLMPGSWASVTLTVNEQVEERFAPSMARHTQVVTPAGNVEPDNGPLTRTSAGAGAQLSVAVGVG